MTEAPKGEGRAADLAALRATVQVLMERVESLQNRRSDAYGVFESMAHLEALVAERTEELKRAKQAVEDTVERRTRELKLKAEALERANQMLQEMDRMKTHLLQNVSHELKTPLVSIRGYGELLRFRYAGNLDDTQREFLEIIIRNADHLNRVIEDLVQASQAARGISPLEISRFDIVPLVRQVLQEIAPMAERAEVALHVRLPDDPLVVQGDRRQLRQMLLNLVANAVKFTGGCPARNVYFALTPTRSDVLLEVRDTGVGIPKDRIHRIFERFYQVDPTATRKYGGMGIGLSLVHEVVENHDGTIFVESEPGVGTRFLVRLPMSQDLRAVTATVDPLHPRGADVVIVEDQEESALFFKTALEEYGYRVAAFTRPQDALADMIAVVPKLLLLDLSMPGMSGIDLLHALRQRLATEGRALPRVVLMTARSPDELLSLGLDPAVDTVLYKPFTLDALRRAIEANGGPISLQR